MPGPDRQLPFAFVDDLDAPELAPADHHHLARVLRLRDGDPLMVGDGAGRYRAARFGTSLEPDGDIVSAPAPVPALTIGFALTKGDQPELVVQKLTELGVDRIRRSGADRTSCAGTLPRRPATSRPPAAPAVARARPSSATVPGWPEVDRGRGLRRGRPGRRRRARRHGRARPDASCTRACSSVPKGVGRPRSGLAATEAGHAVDRWVGRPNVLRAETTAAVTVGAIAHGGSDPHLTQ